MYKIWVKIWPSGLGHPQTPVEGQHISFKTVTNGSNNILISCKLTKICQFMCFWHFAKFQGSYKRPKMWPPTALGRILVTRRYAYFNRLVGFLLSYIVNEFLFASVHHPAIPSVRPGHDGKSSCGSFRLASGNKECPQKCIFYHVRRGIPEVMEIWNFTRLLSAGRSKALCCYVQIHLHIKLVLSLLDSKVGGRILDFKTASTCRYGFCFSWFLDPLL